MRKLIRTSSAMRFAGGIDAVRCISAFSSSAVVFSLCRYESIAACSVEMNAVLRSVWLEDKSGRSRLSLSQLSGLCSG